jgi:hypothetical protein
LAKQRKLVIASSADMERDVAGLIEEHDLTFPVRAVIVSVYSSVAIGGLVPKDVVGLIRSLRANAAQDTT